MEQPNKLMTWDEMVKQYPDRWVFVEATKSNGINIEEGIVRYVTTDDEMPDVLIKCRKAGLHYKRDRTTEVYFGLGVIEGINFTIDSEELSCGEEDKK